jgi:hypothetical protein
MPAAEGAWEKRRAVTYHETEKAPDAPKTRTSGQPQAARKAGPVIRIAVARGANVVMPRLLADHASDGKMVVGQGLAGGQGATPTAYGMA